MKLIRPYLFAFDLKEAMTAILCLSVVILLPIVGIMVILGYRAEIAEDLDADPDDTRVRSFTFDRFGDYLQRGVWPFLYMLIVALIWGVVYAASYFGFIAVVITTSQGGKPDPVFFFVTVAIFASSITLLYFALTLLSWPFLLYSSFAKRFAFRESLSFAFDFFRRVGGLSIARMLPKIFLDLVVFTIGSLLYCIGYYPAWAITLLADQHLMSQLYRTYLERGGTPIPGSRGSVTVDNLEMGDDFESRSSHPA